MKKTLQIIIGAILTLGATSIFVGTLVEAFHSPEEEISVPMTQEKEEASPSSRLVIPDIGVDARIQNVGRAKNGNMAVPTNYSDVGWYRHGPRPGEVGSAVIDGHVDNGFGLDAVFKNIYRLDPGDDIYVETKDGEKLHFIVEKTETYPADEVPRDLLFNKADRARLNLITCGGTWLPDKKEYELRTVVYAVLK